MPPDAEMARACASVDIVIAPHRIYGPCHPVLLKADMALLKQTGALALDLSGRRIVSVADGEGEHPWWRAAQRLRDNADDTWGFMGAGDAASGPDAAGEAAAGQSASAGPLIAPLH